MAIIKPRHQAVLASAERTEAITDGTPMTTPAGGYVGMRVVIEVTVDGAAASITPTLQGYDELSDSWYTLLTGSAIADVGTTALTVDPRATAAANSVAGLPLPGVWRLNMAVADDDPITYSANVEYYP